MANRRGFLKLLGLAPAVAVIPKVTDAIESFKIQNSTTFGEMGKRSFEVATADEVMSGQNAQQYMTPYTVSKDQVGLGKVKNFGK